MNWRDFFYFSKGERRALTLLLSLIAISWIWLLWTDDEQAVPAEGETVAVPAQKAAVPMEDDSAVHKGSLIIGNIRPDSSVNSPVPKKRSMPFRGRRNSYKPYPRVEKYPAGTLVELNTADTTILKKVPGIGSTFANRIVKYRNLLGGFYTVAQLREVYGIDEERYQSLAVWFVTDTAYLRKLNVNELSAKSLRKHPYVDYRQAKVIEQLRKQKGRLSGWENLQLLEEFTAADAARLAPYLSFE